MLNEMCAQKKPQLPAEPKTAVNRLFCFVIRSLCTHDLSRFRVQGSGICLLNSASQQLLIYRLKALPGAGFSDINTRFISIFLNPMEKTLSGSRYTTVIKMASVIPMFQRVGNSELKSAFLESWQNDSQYFLNLFLIISTILLLSKYLLNISVWIQIILNRW